MFRGPRVNLGLEIMCLHENVYFLLQGIDKFSDAAETSILVSIEGEDANHIDMGSWMPDFEKPDLLASSTTWDARQDQEVGANEINS